VLAPVPKRFWVLSALLAVAAVAFVATVGGCGSGDDEGADRPGVDRILLGKEPGGPRARARLARSDREAQVRARTAATAIETFATDRGGTYVGASVADLRRIDPSVPSTTAVQADATGYSVIVTSELSGTAFTVTKQADGQLAFTCSAPGRGACPASGKWGS
jgi:hypothetical protein